MYSYRFDNKTHGYLLTTQTGKYVANEIRPVFVPELALTGLGQYFEYDPNETRPLMWGIKNTYLIADVDENGNAYGRKVAQLNKTQYGKPLDIQIFFDGKLSLHPVDVDAMVAANAEIMDIVTADAKRRTKELYDESIGRCDIAYIAFSGGKDSVVLLDICHRVLPLSVPVVFSDTDMELPDTYQVVDAVKSLYPEREFITARAETPALENWKVFGPPSRTIRWCCSVHKSTPALMTLKKRLHKTALKVMAFVGVRGDESHSRSFYEDTSDGVKNASQLNRMPILDWGSHELWLYIFANRLVVNEAYKKGIARVGCIACPDSAARYMWFAKEVYPQLIRKYEDIIIETSTKNFLTADERDEFVGTVDWGARKSGVVLKMTLPNPSQAITNLNVTFESQFLKKDVFLEWIKTVGSVVVEKESGQSLLKIPTKIDSGLPFHYQMTNTGGAAVTFEFRSESERNELLPTLQNVFRKTIACVGCQTCEAQCNFGAISFKNKKIEVDAQRCRRCYRCYDIDFGCWRFKSMYKSDNEQNKMSGINKYNHFGLREDWIAALIDLGDNFFPWHESHPLGNKMVQSASAWFQQAMLIEPKTRKMTVLSKVFEEKGVANAVGWELIWIALANNAILVKWFVTETDIERLYSVEQLLDKLSENYPSLGTSTKKDGITSLKESISRSPLGSDGGVAVCEFSGKIFKSITRKAKEVHPLTILYGLYLIAKLSGRNSFTVRELLTADVDSVFVSPIVAFGIAPDTFKRQCEGLRTRYPDYISTTFTHGNDGIEIYPEKHNLWDVVYLALEELQ